MPNIYATAVNYKGRAVLLIGPSASGKSDLALRLIVRHGARLIADDRTDIRAEEGFLRVSAPDNIAGLLEVRGIGIQKVPFDREGTAALLVELVDSPQGSSRRRLSNVCLPRSLRNLKVFRCRKFGSGLLRVRPRTRLL